MLARRPEGTERAGFRSLIVVTSDFHMPRALLELRATMPQVNLISLIPAVESTDEVEAALVALRRRGRGGCALELQIQYLAILAGAASSEKAGPQDPPADTSAGAKT